MANENQLEWLTIMDKLFSACAAVVISRLIALIVKKIIINSYTLMKKSFSYFRIMSSSLNKIRQHLSLDIRCLTNAILLAASTCALCADNLESDSNYSNLTAPGECNMIYSDDFSNLDNWHLEGLLGGVTTSNNGYMRLDCSNSEQGGTGVMAFCVVEFPDNIVLEYDLYIEAQNGLFIAFLAMRGLNGEDAILGVPLRKGIFGEYVGINATTRSYHISLSRYDDAGKHTGVSNWRRNPGLHLVGQGEDPCTEINRWYSIKIVKSGTKCKIYVDGQFASGFEDDLALEGEIPSSGKIGFRAIGKSAIFRVSNFRVSKLPQSSER